MPILLHGLGIRLNSVALQGSSALLFYTLWYHLPRASGWWNYAAVLPATCLRRSRFQDYDYRAKHGFYRRGRHPPVRRLLWVASTWLCR